MQWNEHVWSLFLHILPYCNPIRTENAAKNIKLSIFLHWISLNKMASTVNFRTSLRRHNVITVRNVFANKKIGEMISLVHNAFRI